MFKKGDIVRHIKTGGVYVIVSDRSDYLHIESPSAKPAYAYKKVGVAIAITWVHPCDEMEDGRFERVQA